MVGRQGHDLLLRAQGGAVHLWKMTSFAREVAKQANQQVLKAQAAPQDDAGSHQEP